MELWASIVTNEFALHISNSSYELKNYIRTFLMIILRLRNSSYSISIFFCWSATRNSFTLSWKQFLLIHRRSASPLPSEIALHASNPSHYSRNASVLVNEAQFPFYQTSTVTGFHFLLLCLAFMWTDVSNANHCLGQHPPRTRGRASVLHNVQSWRSLFELRYFRHLWI